MENLENKYICKYCNKEFKRKRSLTFHINVKHLKIIRANCKTVTTKKKCPKCSREITVINFNKHLRACGKSKGRKEITEILSKCTIKDNKYVCPICSKEYSKMGIATHIWRCHTNQGKILNPNKGYKNGTRIAWNKGLTKETDERIKKQGQKYSKNHKLGLHKNPIIKDKETWIKNISKGMKKAHEEGRAWNIGKSRWNNEPSYPEKWFMEVIENEFLDKNYNYEYTFSIYSLDFAWVHKKKCIEIDGEQHEKFLEQKERDTRKDNLLSQNGWKVLRIKWSKCFKDTKTWIKIAKDFIDK